MRLAALRTFGLGCPRATVTRQWEDQLVFKVAGKMFFMISLDGDVIEAVAFKCSASEFARLMELDGVIPAPYLARASWVRVEDLAALPAAELEHAIRQSYELVRARLPKKTQATFETSSDSAQT